ncbi:MAG: hypothetical protein K2Y23_13815 [Cyanobacteria bacterium]|nr:hypothetical protein [Cyanobacteriota bacterium]
MVERSNELRAILRAVRTRWSRRAFLRGWMNGAWTAAAMLVVGLLAVFLVAQEGLPLVFVVVTVGVIAGIALSVSLLPLRWPPADRQIARFIEEQAGGLDEVVVTAVDKLEKESGPVVDLLVGDAVRAARTVDPHRIVPGHTMSRAAIGAAIGSVAFLTAFWFFAPSAEKAIDVAGSYLFPRYYAIEVIPGSVKVREGQSVTVTARIPGISGGLIPMITVGSGEAARSAKMGPGPNRDEFTITLNNIAASFPYMVSAGSAHSDEYQIEIIRPARVSRIDLKYEYAPGVGLESHTEEDGGDIYAPAGTKVALTITTDKPVSRGRLTMNEGPAIALVGHSQVLTANLVVSKDGSYRIALNDVDGLSNAGDTEYFIRMLNDRPPEVRIMRPAGDKQVSPLEEVEIEARADDDYGVRSLELVIKSAAGREKVIPIGAPIRGSVAAGLHTVFLEDLKVKPGDVVTYHARAADVGRGRKSTESRSDIFFLEVKPYEEEFVAAESNGGGMSGPQETGLEDLIARQKDIMAATWKLDSRARRGGAGVQSAADVRAVGQAQTALKAKTEEVASQIAAGFAQQRRRRGPAGTLTRPGEDPLPKAIEAMGLAAVELDRLKVTTALPHEEQALAELLKAAAEIRRRQIAMQQANGGGGNGNRNQPDLSTLFDQELRKQQQTNYEQQSTTADAAQQNQQEQKDPLEAIRELARRQEALAKQQRDLANNKDQMSAEEVKRQLERLTRDQEELRRQAEELAKQTQDRQAGRQADRQTGRQAGQQSQGGQGSSGSQSSEGEKLRQVSEEMRQAAGDLRNQDPKQASARGAKAGEGLRGVEQQMQGSRPEERKRAVGDAQLEARQIADAQRRLGNEASRTAAGDAGQDARRRLASEQEKLADRAQRLGESVKQLANGAGAQPDEKQAMTEAGRELDKQNVAGRMRESAQAMRETGSREPGAGSRNEAEEIARALDKVGDQLGGAGERDGETAKLSEQLSRAQELRDRLGKLQRTMEELEKAGASGASGASGAQPASQGREGSSGQQGSSAGGRDGVAKLQRDAEEQMREAQKLAEGMQRENPGMQKGGSTPEQWQRSVSAPGTEAFKQDFAKWEELKNNLLVALDQTESKLSDQLRARETRERLNAGRHDAVGDTYRALVDRYYQSLAAPRRQNR